MSNPQRIARKTLSGPLHPLWKGDDAGWSAKHRRAQRLFRVLGNCQRCGRKAADRHHIDGNPGNNTKSNIMLLCVRCHQVIDGRHERFMEIAKSSDLKRKPPRECVNCHTVAKHYANGLCEPCWKYLRRHGSSRPYSDWHKEIERKKLLPCLRCGRPAGRRGRQVKGYCLSCYHTVRGRK